MDKITPMQPVTAPSTLGLTSNAAHPASAAAIAALYGLFSNPPHTIVQWIGAVITGLLAIYAVIGQK